MTEEQLAAIEAQAWDRGLPPSAVKELCEEVRRLQQLVESWKEVSLRLGVTYYKDESERLQARVTALEDALRTALEIASYEARTAHINEQSFVDIERLRAVTEGRE